MLASIDIHALQKDLIDPAVNGTKNVLGSVSKYKSTVKRVVLTSSFAGNIPCSSSPTPPSLNGTDKPAPSEFLADNSKQGCT